MLKTDIAEPDIAEVKRLVETGPVPGTTCRTIDVQHALAALRSDNAALRHRIKTNDENNGRNQETHKKNHEHSRKEILKLQEQLLASQDRVYELQKTLLSLREVANST